jgi:hypothetical protein
MDFLTWCRSSDRWRSHAWANDRRTRLPADTPETREAYEETFVAAGYGGYLHRLAEETVHTGSSAWAEYVTAMGAEGGS